MLTQDKKLDVVFLVEIKLDVRKMDVFRRRIGFVGFLTVGAIGRNGSLAMLWVIEGQVEV